MLEIAPPQTNSKVTRTEITVVSLLSIIYLVLSYILIGFKNDQLTLVLVFNVCFYATPFTKKMMLAYLIFIVNWVVFDFMKAFPNYLFNEVHIADLYNAEKRWFGVWEAGQLITPNEYFRLHANTFLDVMSGIFYLSWVPVPLALGFYLFLKKKRMFLYFALTFLFVNLLGYVAYYVYPAAPPWYVEKHGFLLNFGTLANRASLERFDAFFHLGVFKSIYTKGSNVFAAVPSLHSAYPVIVFYYGLKAKMGWWNAFFACVMVGIWFTAVYSSHHYVIDVLLGIVFALGGIFLFNEVLLKSKAIVKALDKYEKII
jgi:hypothetical protein